MQFGDFKIDIIDDGFFRLDGGAMYGVVPKNMWSRVEEVDNQNRILMSCNPVLVQGEGFKLLIDTGVGDKFPEKFNRIYGIDLPRGLVPGLEKLGLKPEDITHVLNTHLHFDHCGGNTAYDENNEPVPAFPNAQYCINRLEWEDALDPSPRSKASYLPENLVPLKEAGLLRLTDGDEEIVPGIRVKVTGGHTRGHQIVYIETVGKTAVYLADLIPLTAQIKANWVMAYDLYPVETVDFKDEFIVEAMENDYLLLFEHSPRIKAGYLRKDDNGKLMVEKAAV